MNPINLKSLEVKKRERKEVETDKGEFEDFTVILKDDVNAVTVTIKTPDELEELIQGTKVDVTISRQQRTLKDVEKDLKRIKG